jgi:YidC/Oxa1 family membrane protein insertase
MDRRAVAAIVLMMAIAMLPAVFFRKPPQRQPLRDTVPVTATAPAPVAGAPPSVAAAPATATPDSAAAAVPIKTVRVTSPLYRYGISTRGARLVEATLTTYRSMFPGDSGQAVELLHPSSDLLGLRLVAGKDTVSLADWDFVPSSDSVAASAETPLTMTATRGGVTVALHYRFQPETYVVSVDGQVDGLGPNGGTLVIGMGPGLRNTEVDSVEHMRNLGVVTMSDQTRRTDFSSLKPTVATELSGPFDWVAIKSKYFVVAVFAVDSTSSGVTGRLSGVRAVATDQRKRPAEADVRTSLSIPASGAFHFTLFAGPMDYPRLRAMGHEFYDVNPYGWPGFRTIIRPVSLAARWLLVKLHDLGIAYGLGLIIFGIGIRLALWPLNQKAMRASMQMQAIQPLLKDLQDRHKEDPQRLQQEMFKLYKEYKVNPFGGCWPMLLPMPILFALFFVFQNTIELRGASFLWLPDLSRADPLFIIPVVMGLSMYVVSKVGQIGMAPNPQMKMMLYLMPVMMTVMFLKFAAGLNLYYAVQNLASVPQQWLLAKERLKANPPKPALVAKTPPKK